MTSAAEIVAACLQDHDRTLVVGQRSFGKGSVQHILPLEDGESVIKLTVSTYHRPSGKNIHKGKDAQDSDDWGVSPSTGLEVKLSPKEYEAWFDARRKRDMISGIHKPKDQAEAEKAKADATKDKDLPGDAGPADRQLAKALEVVRGKLDAPTEAAAKERAVPPG